MDGERAPRPGLDALLAAAVALVGVALGLHYARMGFMPLDSLLSMVLKSQKSQQYSRVTLESAL